MLYRIADLIVEMECSPSGRTLRQAEAYRTRSDESPHMRLSSPASVAEIARREFPLFSADEGEYMVTCSEFYEQLIAFDGLMLHASALAMDGRGYAFTAPSGTGKSTHAALWRQRFGDRVVYLNDDKPALRMVNGEARLYGTPWSGKTDQNCNAYAPLCGICVLSRGEKNSIQPLSVTEALPFLLSQTLRPKAPLFLEKLLATLDQILRQVPVYALCCTVSEEAAEVAYRTLCGTRQEERL